MGLDAAAVETSFFPKPVEIAKIEDSSHVIITFKKLDFDSPLITEPLGVDDQEEEQERDNDAHVSNQQEDYLLPPPPLQRRRTAAAPHKYAKKCRSEEEELPRSVRRRVHVTYHESDSSGNGEADDDPGFVHQRLLPPVSLVSQFEMASHLITFFNFSPLSKHLTLNWMLAIADCSLSFSIIVTKMESVSGL